MATSYTEIVTKPVVLTAVAELLGTNIKDLGLLCGGDNNNVNMWAKFKPFRADKDHEGTLFFAEDTDSTKTDRAVALKNAHYGLDLTKGTNADNDGGYGLFSLLTDALNNALSKVVYNKPRGNSVTPYEPYRLADFINYKHTAKVPIWAETSYPTYTGDSDGNVKGIYFYYNDDDDERVLHLKDLSFIQTDDSFYFGVFLFNTTHQFIASTDKTLADITLIEGISVDFDGVCSETDSTCITSIDGETFSLLPVLLTQKIDSAINLNHSQTYLGKIYPLTFAMAKNAINIKRYNKNTDSPIVINSVAVIWFSENTSASLINEKTINTNLYWIAYIHNNTTSSATGTVTLTAGGVTLYTGSITIAGKATWSPSIPTTDPQYQLAEIDSDKASQVIAQLKNGSSVTATLTFTQSAGSALINSSVIQNGRSLNPSD